MPTNDADFINAIVANPQDEALRLAYAAWLEDRNETLDSERASFLRIQCELRGKPETGESYWALYQRLSDVEYKLKDEAWPVWVHNDLAIPPGLTEKGQRAAMTILEVLANEKFAFTGGCRLFWTPSEWRR
ncbi:MAG TPA: TIGR02996 domain-containing protein [Gemmataceae bacterium]|nr:TIGR02996 domain-containing protein [Gemmataceae bacterium]